MLSSAGVCCLKSQSELRYKGILLPRSMSCPTSVSLISSLNKNFVLLMSDPARLLQSLHLGEMPVTRSQAHSTTQRGGRNPRASRGRGRPPPPLATSGQAFPPQSDPVRSYTGRQYYTQALSPLSAQRATEGLESNFLVERVQSYDSGRERYYAFQLKTPVAVRIYEPNAGRARIECSCEAHRATESECAHIYVGRWKTPLLSAN